MALTVDIRRVGLALLTLLVALAVIGPACLVFASHAFAMPEEAPSKGCESSDSPVGVCPHDDSVKITATATVVTPVLFAVVPMGPLDATTSVELASLAPTGIPPGAPVAHLTPLRI